MAVRINEKKLQERMDLALKTILSFRKEMVPFSKKTLMEEFIVKKSIKE